MIQVVNKYKHKPTLNDVFIGRPSLYGNPYSHMSNTAALYRTSSRDEAVNKYREYILNRRQHDDAFAQSLNDLANKAKQGDVNLVCYCHPLRCHGQILKELLESEYL
jgi:hypothetical protein